MSLRVDMAQAEVARVAARLVAALVARRDFGDRRPMYALVEAFDRAEPRGWWRPVAEAQPRFQATLKRRPLVALVTWPEHPCRGTVAVSVPVDSSRRPSRERQVCSRAKCHAEHHARGLCHAHYAAARRLRRYPAGAVAPEAA